MEIEHAVWVVGDRKSLTKDSSSQKKEKPVQSVKKHLRIIWGYVITIIVHIGRLPYTHVTSVILLVTIEEDSFSTKKMSMMIVVHLCVNFVQPYVKRRTHCKIM